MWCFMHLLVCMVVMWATALLTLDERKMLADIQLSSGPSKVGYFGFLQQFSDAFKLLLKEFVTPSQLSENMFLYAGMISFMLSTFFWIFLPFTLDNGVDTSSLNMFFMFLFTMLHAYTMMTAGWSSNSKYSFLGGMSVSSQLMSYDMPNAVVYMNMSTFMKELDILSFTEFQMENNTGLKLFTMHFVIFLMTNLAECSSHPFDLTEAEAELVSGFNVEYSSISFALFFLAEYASAIFLSMFMKNIFFHSYFTNFVAFEWMLKVFFIVFLIMYMSGLMPSYSYDQLMSLSWSCLIPIEFSTLMFNSSLPFWMS